MSRFGGQVSVEYKGEARETMGTKLTWYTRSTKLLDSWGCYTEQLCDLNFLSTLLETVYTVTLLTCNEFKGYSVMISP